MRDHGLSSYCRGWMVELERVWSSVQRGCIGYSRALAVSGRERVLRALDARLQQEACRRRQNGGIKDRIVQWLKEKIVHFRTKAYNFAQ